MKFRVWDIDNNKYLKEERKFHFYLNADGTLMISTGWNDEKLPCDYEIADPDKYIIEWGSGLNDSKNKEIHEGDIIKFQDGEICSVIFFCGEFAIKQKMKISYHITSIKYHFAVCEIIGNIHENKELLQSKE